MKIIFKMFKINLKNVKNIKNFSLTIPEHGITRLDGCSGSGKTTILNAIQMLITNKGKFPGSEAELCFDNIVIKRVKNPHKLSVSINNNNIIDEEAQCWIDENFTISYIQQSGLDSFLIAPSVERRICLEKMAGFENEETKKMEEIIIDDLKTAETNHNRLVIEENFMKNLISEEPKGKKCDTVHVSMLMKQLRKERDELLVQLKLEEHNEKQNAIRQEISNIKDECNNLIHKLSSEDSDNEKYTVAKKWTDVLHIRQQLPSITQTCIENDIEKLRLVKHENCQYENEMTRCRQIIRELDCLEPESIVSCPHETCAKAIEIVDNKLFKTEKDITGIISNGKRKRTHSESIELSEAKSMIKKPKPEYFDIQRLRELENLLKTSKDCQDRLYKIGHVDQCDYDVDELEKKIIEHENNRKKLSNLNIKRQTLEGLDLSVSEFECIGKDRVEKKIFTLDEKLRELDIEIELDNQNISYQAKQAQYDMLRQQVLDSNNNKYGCSGLKTCWIEAKTHCIDKVVDILQTHVNSMVVQFFKQPISIMISCWKSSTKSRGEKAGFEIEICLDNRLSTLYDLSGGEKSRVSIAFSCALAVMRQSKLLMLDESISGLDDANVENILNVLKTWSKANKIPIILVSHNATLGLCDNVITI